MGELADEHVGNFLSGRWGQRIQSLPEMPKTTRAAIAHQVFHIVEVVGGNTNRIPGTVLVVTARDDEYYWVWASQRVTGIAKKVCRAREADLTLAEALAKTGRKPYRP